MTLDFRPCGRKISNRGPCKNSCTDIYKTLKAPLNSFAAARGQVGDTAFCQLLWTPVIIEHQHPPITKTNATYETLGSFDCSRRCMVLSAMSLRDEFTYKKHHTKNKQTNYRICIFTEINKL